MPPLLLVWDEVVVYNENMKSLYMNGQNKIICVYVNPTEKFVLSFLAKHCKILVLKT
jgi:hypothetical protein